MDIQRAKEEIKRAVQAYPCHGRHWPPADPPPCGSAPILLMGPPGVGKTQIMEQIAQECNIALVAYTITHHTRQSAVGLPFIRERNYGGRTRSVTEYTMSEIIASVYAAMERTGKKKRHPVHRRDQLRQRDAGPPRCCNFCSAKPSAIRLCRAAGSLWPRAIRRSTTRACGSLTLSRWTACGVSTLSRS